MVSQLHKVAAQKRDDREAKLSVYRSSRISVPDGAVDLSQYPLTKLTETERAIVQCDATRIVELIRKRAHTAEDVLMAFVKVAIAAQDITNCLSEVYFEEAFVRARELDHHLETTGDVVGPLHGLPVSIKDHIKVKGLDTSSGYLGWANNTVADSDALVVKILRDAGAIIYVKTQNPQTLLSLETENNIFGRTDNPFNLNLTPGGSSGGEGALIACHGSPLGVGTDIGGSIRIPAAHCGLYGLKASVARLPHSGLLGSHDGMDAIVGCVGPLATSARDLELFCRTMLDAKPWLDEHCLLEMPWNSVVASGKGLPEKLTIAVLFDDGVVAPHAPIIEALNRYKDALVRAGHDVIEWKALDHQNGWDLIVKLYLLDGGAEYQETIRAGEEYMLPQTEWMLRHAQGRDPYTPAQIFKLNLEREAFRSKALAHWNSTRNRTASGCPVDAILCPVAPTLAPPHYTTRWWGYTSHWNLLDLPAVAFPVHHFKATESATYPPLPPARNDIERFIHDQWDPAIYNNAPISLQLVGRRHNEEKLLAMLNVLEQAVQNNSCTANVTCCD